MQFSCRSFGTPHRRCAASQRMAGPILARVMDDDEAYLMHQSPRLVHKV